MMGRRFCSLFLVIMMEREIFLDPVAALAHLPKKKVLLVNDDEMLSRTYSLEDFFWTGSGDGPLPPQDKSSHPTIVRTTTVLATVFLDSPSSLTTDPSSHNDEDCLTECPINPATGEIYPTKVSDSGEESNGSGSLPDPRYWILTVLRAPASPLPPSLSRSLARLYQRAFSRQQEQHLGIVTSSANIRKKHHSLRNATNNATRRVHKLNSVNYNVNLNISETLERFNDDGRNTSDDESYVNGTAIDMSIVTLNSTAHTLVKRSAHNIAEELNIILMRNFTHYNYSNTLDLVKREIYNEIGQPVVEVFLHNLSREGKSGDKDELKVVYWVSVGGRPVPAWTAARDMKLLADSEVVAELGYPVTTKAEPYLKSPESPNGVIAATNMRDIWLIIGGAILAAFIILSLVAILAFRLINRRKSSATSRNSRKRSSLHDKHIQYPGIMGKDNKAYLEDDNNKKLISVISPHKKNQEERYLTNGDGYQQGPDYIVDNFNSTGSSSSSLSASDLSQMTATLHQKQRLFEKQMQNEYSTVNKKNKSKHRRIRSKKVGVADESLISDTGRVSDKFLSSPSSRSTSSCDSVIIRKPQGLISPTSYLSMPSVKSFPRGNAVEPLSRVLEPLSVKHLDMDSDSPVHVGHKKNKRKDFNYEDMPKSSKSSLKSVKNEEKINISSNLVRMGSMDKDPGVIGPMVWDLHRQRLDKESMENEAVAGNNISKMRQRFSELVDDAFSLFGSGSSSPKSVKTIPQTKSENLIVEPDKPTLPVPSKDNRRHSAKEGILVHPQSSKRYEDRPHTALPPRPPLPQSLNSTSAWGSSDGAAMMRASSAGGVRRPTIDVTLINPDSLNDPANQLIQSIRKELDRLPGTSDA